MKNIKTFEGFINENFENSLIPKDILDKLHSTDHKGILETLDDLENELNGDRDDTKLWAYVDDIGVYLDDTSMDRKEADDIYFRLTKLIKEYGKDLFQ